MADLNARVEYWQRRKAGLTSGEPRGDTVPDATIDVLSDIPFSVLR
jgi:hypothetical protein